MAKNRNRDELLAFVAEKYYLERFKQTDIAEMIGLTRSAVSRILTEAKEKGIVEIIIHYPIKYADDLEEELKKVFDLKGTSVVVFQNQPNYKELRTGLGRATSKYLSTLIKPGYKIGISWGTTVQAAIEAYEPNPVKNTQIIQLVGVLGSSRHSYSSQILVEQLAAKIDGEGTYLYTPFIVESETTATSLLEDPLVDKAITDWKECDIAVMGIGSIKPEYCSLYQGNYLSLEEVNNIQAAGAVGDVCGLYFNPVGVLTQVSFHQRRIGISFSGLREIPTRLGVAGHHEKAEAIHGALIGGFINTLVTDNHTAIRVLELAEELGRNENN